MIKLLIVHRNHTYGDGENRKSEQSASLSNCPEIVTKYNKGKELPNEVNSKT
jgi:hypothetical protein